MANNMMRGYRTEIGLSVSILTLLDELLVTNLQRSSCRQATVAYNGQIHVSFD